MALICFADIINVKEVLFMKKTIIAVLCAAMLLGLSGCGNANSTSSAQSGAQESKNEVVQESENQVSKYEYFDEKPDMVKPILGASYLRKEDDTYYYSLSEDSEKAIAAAEMYLNILKNTDGFDVQNVEDSTYYNIYDDEEQFALVGLAKDGSDYVLAIAFFNT